VQPAQLSLLPEPCPAPTIRILPHLPEPEASEVIGSQHVAGGRPLLVRAGCTASPRFYAACPMTPSVQLGGLHVRIETELAMGGASSTAVHDRYRLTTTLLDDRRFLADGLVRLTTNAGDRERRAHATPHCSPSTFRAPLIEPQQEVCALLPGRAPRRLNPTSSPSTPPWTPTTAAHVPRPGLRRSFRHHPSASSKLNRPQLPTRRQLVIAIPLSEPRGEPTSRGRNRSGLRNQDERVLHRDERRPRALRPGKRDAQLDLLLEMTAKPQLLGIGREKRDASPVEAGALAPQPARRRNRSAPRQRRLRGVVPS
jgi:hypothetical protein